MSDEHFIAWWFPPVATFPTAIMLQASVTRWDSVNGSADVISALGINEPWQWVMGGI